MRPFRISLISSVLASSLGIASAEILSHNQLLRHDIHQVLENKPTGHDSCRHQLTGPIETTQCDYETVEHINEELFNRLHELVGTPFFKYFRTDLYRECPFWQENMFCMQRDCAISSVDESEVPEKWRAAALSKVEMPATELRKALPGCYYRDSDFCFFDDVTDGEYVDLTQNPERFSGYSGPSAHRVWSSIYNENCFGLSELNVLSSPSPADVSIAPQLMEINEADGADPSGQCLEKRVYYRIISGLHASISTHICYENMKDQTVGEYAPDLECYIERVASHPERLQNIYFNTVLMLRTLSRIGPYLSAYDLCTGNEQTDNFTKNKLHEIIDIANHVGTFDETVLFRGESATVLKQEFKEHFRNVSRIMDCVGCDKCRLWGKVQVTGVATALKVLFELDEKTLDPAANPYLLQRAEVVAFVNTLHRFTESLHAADEFRKMWAEMKETDQDASQSILDHVSKTSAAQKARHTSRLQPTSLLEFIGEIWKERIMGLLITCRRGTIACMQTFARIFSNIMSVLSTLLEPSSKFKGPSEL